MPDVAVRGLTKAGSRRRASVVLAPLAVMAAALGDAACDGSLAPTEAAERAYLRDAASRRAALVSSLVNPENGYSALRLAHYASGTDGDWDRLVPWNPRVAPVTVAELDLPSSNESSNESSDRSSDRSSDTGASAAALPDAAYPLAVPDEATWEPSIPLEALGEEAFFRYPVQLAPPPPGPLTRLLAERYGLWLDPVRGVGGLVRAEVPGGTVLAMTCASCHADVIDGRLIAGVPSARFDLGRLIIDAAAPAPDPDQTARLLAWGSGRVDVTTADGSLPERISDLRPLRWLTHLQYDATVRQRDVVALAIRVETLIITSHGQVIRPPRIVALALARYLASLSASLPMPGSGPPQGRALFEARCSGCHAGDGFTGVPRALAEVGTDPTLGLSPDRGTGMYRVPSLRGVATRPTLLHDGTIPDLEGLFDPARVGSEWTGGARGPGPVKGHPFGLDLSATDRAALIQYVSEI